MKVVALVPIKLNNERLKNKNLLELEEGKPLISYILETLKKVPQVDKIIVYCSDESIQSFLPDGIEYLKRDVSLDLNTTKMNDVIEYFMSEIDSDVYLLTHATTPFISANSISLGLSKVLNDEYDSAFSVEELKDFIWYENKPLNYDLSSIPRTQDLEPVLKETCGFYIFEKGVFLKNKRRIGDNSFKVPVSAVEAIDIDEESDFIWASMVAKNKEFLNGTKAEK